METYLLKFFVGVAVGIILLLIAVVSNKGKS